MATDGLFLNDVCSVNSLCFAMRNSFQISRDKVCAISAYLALQQGRPVQRDQLNILFWDDYSATRAAPLLAPKLERGAHQR